MNKQKMTRTAMAHAAVLTVAAEIAEELKGTSIYQQAEKRKINAVVEAIEQREVNFRKSGFYDNGMVEFQFRQMQEIIDAFKEALIDGPFESLPLLVSGLRNFRDGNFIDSDDEPISLYIKEKTTPKLKLIIDSLRSSGVKDTQIVTYMSDLVQKTSVKEDQQKSA